MKRAIVTILAMLLSGAAPAAAAEMTIVVNIYSGRSVLFTVVLPSQFSATQLGQHTGANPTAFQVGVTGYVPQQTVLRLQDQNGTYPLYPITLSEAFAGLEFQYDYYDRSYFDQRGFSFRLDEVIRECDFVMRKDVTPIDEAFERLSYCREAVLLWEARGHVWHPGYSHALWGWFAAAYYLYAKTVTLPSGAVVHVSPYGFDSELLARVQRTIAQVENREVTGGTERPIRIDDFRQAVAEVTGESVRFAGFLPQLIAADERELARDLATFVDGEFGAAAAALGVEVINGVTRDLNGALGLLGL